MIQRDKAYHSPRGVRRRAQYEAGNSLRDVSSISLPTRRHVLFYLQRCPRYLGAATLRRNCVQLHLAMATVRYFQQATPGGGFAVPVMSTEPYPSKEKRETFGRSHLHRYGPAGNNVNHASD